MGEKMKGKIRSLVVLCIICIFTISAQTVVYANEEDFFPEVEVPIEYEEEPVISSGVLIQPYFSYIDGFTVQLRISGNKATCSGTMSGTASTTKVAIFMYLQKYDYDAGAWKTYANWSKTKEDDAITISETATIVKGTYRVKCSYWGYNGTLSENTIAYSTAYAK